MKDVGVISYRELKNMAYDRQIWRGYNIKAAMEQNMAESYNKIGITGWVLRSLETGEKEKVFKRNFTLFS